MNVDNDVANLEYGQLVIYAGEGKDGEILFTSNGKGCLSFWIMHTPG